MAVQTVSVNSFHNLKKTHPNEFQSLNKFVRIDLNQEATRLSKNARYYSMISTALKITFAGFGIAILIPLSMYVATPYVFIFLNLYTIVLCPKINQIINKHFKDPAQSYLEHSNRTRDIINKTNQYISPTSNDQMTLRLKEIGLCSDAIKHQETLKLADSTIHLKPLIPLITRYQHWEETANQQKDHSIELFQRAKKIEEELVPKRINLPLETSDNKPLLQAEITKLDHEKRQLRDQAYKQEEFLWLPQKIQAAYQLALISDIKMQDHSTDIGCLMQYSSPLIRAQNIEYNEPNPYFIFKDPMRDPVDREWIKSATIPMIAQHIFKAVAIINESEVAIINESEVAIIDESEKASIATVENTQNNPQS